MLPGTLPLFLQDRGGGRWGSSPGWWGRPGTASRATKLSGQAVRSNKPTLSPRPTHGGGPWEIVQTMTSGWAQLGRTTVCSLVYEVACPMQMFSILKVFILWPWQSTLSKHLIFFQRLHFDSLSFSSAHQAPCEHLFGAQLRVREAERTGSWPPVTAVSW